MTSASARIGIARRPVTERHLPPGGATAGSGVAPGRPIALLVVVAAGSACPWQRIVDRAAAEDFESLGRDMAPRDELLRAATADGLTRVHVALGVDGHRVEQRELARLVAGTSEAAEDPVAGESVEDPERTVSDVVHVHVFLNAVDREVEVVRRSDRASATPVRLSVRSGD